MRRLPYWCFRFFSLGRGSFFLSIVCLWVPLLLLLNAIALKRVEQPELELRFGASYRDYKRRVPMFVPRLPRPESKKTTARLKHVPGDELTKRAPCGGASLGTGDLSAQGQTRASRAKASRHHVRRRPGPTEVLFHERPP